MSAVVSVGADGPTMPTVTWLATETSCVAVLAGCDASVARSVMLAFDVPAVKSPLGETVHPLAAPSIVHTADTGLSLNRALNCAVVAGAMRGGPVTRKPLPGVTTTVTVADFATSATLVARTAYEPAVAGAV